MLVPLLEKALIQQNHILSHVMDTLFYWHSSTYFEYH